MKLRALFALALLACGQSTAPRRDPPPSASPAPAPVGEEAVVDAAAPPADARAIEAGTKPPPESPPPGWTLVWSDEFTGAAGGRPDPSKWKLEEGGTGWGNGELQYYSNRVQNSYLDGNGSLVIQVFQEAYKGKSYSSARMKTQGLFSQKYGRFEARMKLPYGIGLWPAFWLLGDDFSTAGWPACGEIDVMENAGWEPSVAHGSLHGPGYSAGKAITAKYHLPAGETFSADYHLFAIEWESDTIRFYVDGDLYARQTPQKLPQGTEWVFNHPHFIILNVAVGGVFPKYPDDTTVFPQRMFVDYVRVYRRSGG